MNSYGDPQSARARARVPGSSTASTPDDGTSGSRPAPDTYRRPSGRAGVSGSVPRGAASVGGTSGRVPVGAATAGRAPVGSARVGGRTAVGEGGTGAYGGRAAVARASVRPTSYDEFDGPGSPAPLGGPGKGAKELSKAAKRRRRANILTAAAAVVVILLGAGVVAGTWYFDDVRLEEPKPEDQVTQLFAADNKTLLATVGRENRSIVPYQSISPVIKDAVMAAEDKNFTEHNGIDMKGILRAAWNNFTGGDTQGASTITQQYARHAAELKEISYNRKLREAVLARKIEDKFTKDEILGRYLNSVYFGRGAYGIEAAVKAYFGNSRSSLVQPGQKGAITAAEAAVIASVIKQPEPSATHQGYDPQNNLPDAKVRWEYTLNNMVEKGWLAAADKPTEYPAVKKFDPNACRTGCGNDKPTYKITKYVKQELRAMGIDDKEQAAGGLRITTTINSDVQKAAETAAARTSEESPMSELDKTYKSALVAVDPSDGQVLAYYGGANGTDWDYAGPNFAEDGSFLGGGRPPGSSFKIYTLLAGLSAGYSFKTTWDSTLKRVGGDAINNSNRNNLKCDKRRCPLETATVESYNFPFYWLAQKMGAAKVIEAAHKAGVQYISDPDKIGARLDLSKTSESDLDRFGSEVGFGQYAITVLDHANGVATLAADGVYNKAHFVKKVEKRDDKTGKFKPYKNEQLKPKQAFDRNVVAAIDHVLQKIPPANGRSLRNGRDAIGKTGTWEYKDGKSGENGDAWMVGATRQIASAVWVGREKPVKKQMQLLPIKKPGGGNMTGGSVPGQIWKVFMDEASKAIDKPNEPFLPNVEVGDPNMKGNGLDPLPEPPQNDGCLLGGLICPPGQGNGQGNGNNNGPGNGNNGQGNGNNNGQGNGDGTPINPPEPGQPGTTLPGFPGDTPDGGNDTGQGGGDG
jgi:membrane peptidoglycan carboxypeptidase